jgi:hypothetical protein
MLSSLPLMKVHIDTVLRTKAGGGEVRRKPVYNHAVLLVNST